MATAAASFIPPTDDSVIPCPGCDISIIIMSIRPNGDTCPECGAGLEKPPGAMCFADQKDSP